MTIGQGQNKKSKKVECIIPYKYIIKLQKLGQFPITNYEEEVKRLKASIINVFENSCGKYSKITSEKKNLDIENGLKYLFSKDEIVEWLNKKTKKAKKREKNNLKPKKIDKLLLKFRNNQLNEEETQKFVSLIIEKYKKF